MGVENWNFAANFLWGKMTQVLLGAEGEGATPLVLVVRHSIRLVRLRRTHFDQISNLPPSFINFLFIQRFLGLVKEAFVSIKIIFSTTLFLD